MFLILIAKIVEILPLHVSGIIVIIFTTVLPYWKMLYFVNFIK